VNRYLDRLEQQRDGVFWLVLYLVRWPVIIPVGYVQGLLASGVVGASDAWRPGVGGGALLVPIVVPPIVETLIECTLPYWILKRLGKIGPARPWTFILISASIMALLHFPVAVPGGFVTGMFLAYGYGHFATRGHAAAFAYTALYHAAINAVGVSLYLLSGSQT